MAQPQTRIDGALHKAIGRLVVGLGKRERKQQEHRRHKRFGFGIKVRLCARRGEGRYDTLCEAWALDISMGGIGCLLTDDIDTEDVGFISFEEVIQQPCHIPIRTKGVRTLFGHLRQIHCEFVYHDVSESADGDQLAGAA